MIRLERPATTPPTLLGERAAAARAAARAWVDDLAGPGRRATKMALVKVAFAPEHGIVEAPDVFEACAAAQLGKCAFCESPVGADDAVVSRFRPATGAVALDGVSSLVHYAWMAYEWSNLHVACLVCDRSKGMRFPVAGDRAPVTGLDDLDPADWENALLLDPFRDDPAVHLVFTGDGRVNSETLEGRATIDCFDLNREDLVRRRAGAMSEARAAWEAGDHDGAVEASAAFAAARRDAARPLAERIAADVPTIEDYDDHLVVGGVSIVKRSVAQQAAAVAAEDSAVAAQAAYDIGDRNADPVYFATAKYIERIEVTNWKPIRHAVLEVPVGRSDRAPWLMLLGENGAGKSSILQGVALALLGARSRDALGLEPDRFIRNGARRAEIKVWLSGIAEPVVLTARRGEPRFGGSESPKVLVLGYGATRLLPSAGPDARPTTVVDAVADVDNLFDPFVPMTDANAWLLGLDDEPFATAVRGLRHLLDLGPDDRFSRYRSAGEVRVRALGSTVPIDRMSDGYQSVLALACDVMAVLLNRWTDLAAAEGVVVVDELGAHLHPRWRMRVVEGLRAHFPRVQFVTSTHDPLCLRGLDDGEVALVERRTDPGRTVAVRQDLPPIAGLRADQLLTSELFGLRSTVDPTIEHDFDEYYALLSHQRPDADQQARITELRDKLASFKLLGDTERERLVYEAADEWLARRDATPPPIEDAGAAATADRAAAVAMLAEVWAERSPERFARKGG